MDLSFKAQQKLAENVMALMPGEDPETKGDTEGRFHEEEQKEEKPIKERDRIMTVYELQQEIFPCSYIS